MSYQAQMAPSGAGMKILIADGVFLYLNAGTFRHKKVTGKHRDSTI